MPASVRRERHNCSGEIRRHATVSWPLGFGGSFHPELTGAQNTRFVARIYGIDTDALVAYVDDFSELGDFMDMPVRSYSSGMRARLAFGMSMGVAFDWYLVDEITAVGDTRFRKKSLAVFAHMLDCRVGPSLLKEYYGKDPRKSVADWTNGVKKRTQKYLLGELDLSKSPLPWPPGHENGEPSP